MSQKRQMFHSWGLMVKETIAKTINKHRLSNSCYKTTENDIYSRLLNHMEFNLQHTKLKTIL